jgi:GTP-binding protein
MANLAKLAIVGRPNVGKSALFNRICKKKIAIVDEAEGVTRDRLYAEAEFFGTPFELIDTGGINARSAALFNAEIKKQAEIAIEEADFIIMVVDGMVGLTDLDAEIALVLQRTRKPLVLAVNKIDDITHTHRMHEFHSLGIPQVITVSAAQGWHIAELLESVFGTALAAFQPTEEDKRLSVSIVGRPNVGKSSLVNYLLDEERCIVSPIAGTTRDSVDVPFMYNDMPFTLIDTAGIRRKHAEHEVVDKFATIRTERAIERSDVCILMLDAQQGMTVQDKKIANMIEEAGKGCLLIFNKWDLVKGFRMEHCLQEVTEQVPFLNHCPKLFISAKTGRNVDKIFDSIIEVQSESQKRITTHQLNKFIESAMQKNHPPMIMGKRLRIYYMAQVAIAPPKFILFVNAPHLMAETYRKYLYNQFRDAYGFTGSPILIHLKGKPKERMVIPKRPPKGLMAPPQAHEDEEGYEDDFEDDFDANFDGTFDKDE